MTQLRHDHQEFAKRNTAIIVVVPNGPRSIERYVTTHAIPYPILTDKGSRVADQYGIETRSFIGVKAMMPTVLLLEPSRKIIYTNYLDSYIKEPDNKEALAMLG